MLRNIVWGPPADAESEEDGKLPQDGGETRGGINVNRRLGPKDSQPERNGHGQNVGKTARIGPTRFEQALTSPNVGLGVPH